jgi:hypothetical protein
MPSSFARIAYALRLLAFALFLPALTGTLARAEIDLFSLDGSPVTLTASMRTRETVWSFFNPGPVANGNNNYQYNFQSNVIRFGAGYELDGIRFFAEAMSPAELELPPNALASPPAGALGTGANYYQTQQSRYTTSLFLKQGYVELGDDLIHGLKVKGGRFEFFDGTELTPTDPQLKWLVNNEVAQRLLGNFGFSDAMRSFDGASLQYGGRDWNALVMYGVPTRGAYDFNGMDEIRRTDVIYGALNKLLESQFGTSLGRAFYIWYDDNRGLIPVDNEPAAAAKTNTRTISISTLGGDFAHKLKAGPGSIDLLIWGAYQIGQWGKLNQSAYAYTMQAGYRFDHLPWMPWIRALYTFGSGDSDSHDSTHGTFFQILPTPRIYALTPIYNMMNTSDLGGQLILDPLKNLQLRTDLDALWLSSSRDRWYAGGGAFDNHLFGYMGRPSFGRSYLGTVVDASATWKVCSHWGLYFYAGQVFGGSVVGSNFPAGRALTFGYAESTISF